MPLMNGATLAPPPKPPPPPRPAPPASTRTGNNPRGVAIAPPPAPTVNDRQAVRQAITTATRGTPRGTAIPSAPLPQTVNDVAAQHPDPASVIKVFNAQPPNLQKAVIRNAQQFPSYPASKIILQHVQQQGRLTHLGTKIGAGGSVPPLAAIASHPGVSLSSLVKAPAGILGHFGTDLVNLAPGTVQGLYGLGKDIVTGHEGNAFHMLVDPYVNLVEHPLKTFEQHPLNSALMFLGAKSLVGKSAGAVARSGALGEDFAKGTSIQRAPLHLGTIAGEPSPLVEHRYYSKDVFNQAVQKARENYLAAKGQNPNVARPAPRAMPDSMRYAFNIGQEAKLARRADELTSVRQQAGRAERAAALDALRKAAPSKESRNVVSHVLQGVIKTPETAVDDATKEINRLQVAQQGLRSRSLDMLYNRRQVKDLTTALHTPIHEESGIPQALHEAFGAAETIRPTLHTQDAYLVAHGLLDPAQALRARLFPYAQAHMGARYNAATDALEVPGSRVVNGVRYGRTRPVTTDEVLQHIKDNGVPDPAYVGHFPGKTSPFRFYSAYKMSRGTLGKGRTGLAFERGGYNHTWEGLAGQVASRAEATTKASLHDRVMNELSVVPSKEIFDRAGVKYTRGLLTTDEANRLARAAMVDDHGNPIPNATELTPIVASPMHTLGAVKDLQHPHELQNLSDLETTSLAHAVHDAQNSTSRNVGLVPRVAAERFQAQFQRGDSMLRSIGKVTQQFRRTVLPYSTHWMTQIASEAGLRAMIAGVFSPHYLADGRRLMQHLENTPEGRSALMEMVNATFYNKRDPMAIYNPNAGKVVSAAKAFPPTRMLISMHNHYADFIGQAMYSLEHNARLMGLGKMAHNEVSSWGKAWQNGVRIQGRNMAQLAENLKADPTLVTHFGREIDNIFGKYSKFTPKERAMIQSLTPFLPWYLNAAKFVLWHLPKDHPMSAALLASLRQTINQDIQDGKQAPLNSYAMQELARITPFGIFSPPSTTPTLSNFLKGQQATGAFLPQAEGSLYNLAGLNSFGEGPLTTTPDPNAPYGSNARKGDVAPLSTAAGVTALNNLLESFVPAARYVRTAREGGGPAYGVSNVISPKPKPGNPGTTNATVNRMFNPFYGFEEAQKSKSAPKYTSDKQQAAQKASSSSGGWGFSSGPAPASSGSGWGFSSGGSSSGSSSGWGF